MVIASSDESGPWIANVYFCADDSGELYFISPEKNRHSQMILQNPNVAFSVAWFDSNNHKNRKGVQGLGTCHIAESEEEIEIGVGLYSANFPESKERITAEWVHTNEWGSKVWILKPSYMKYWDDELYGDDESKEFVIS